MLRLHDLTEEQMEQWRYCRMQAGQAKYQDAHMHRYNAVDIAEELLDAINIHALMWERTQGQLGERGLELYGQLQGQMYQALDTLRRLDKRLPDEHCTDDTERIYWTIKANIASEGRDGRGQVL